MRANRILCSQFGKEIFGFWLYLCNVWSCFDTGTFDGGGGLHRSFILEVVFLDQVLNVYSMEAGS